MVPVRREWRRTNGIAATILGLLLAWSASPTAAQTREVGILAQAYPGCLCYTHWFLAEDIYAEKFGYTLKFNPGTTIQNPIQILMAGVVDFAEVDPFEIISAKSKGVPIEVIATTTAVSPVAFHSLAKNGITKPRDLMGKTVGFFPGGDHEMIFWEVMDRAGLTPEEQATITGKVIGVSIQPLLAGRVDARSYWTPVEFLKIVELTGTDLNTIQATDYDVYVPANAIVVRQEMLEKEPKYVEQALAAFAKGLEARMNPDMRDTAIEAASKRIDPKMFHYPEDVIRKAQEQSFDGYMKFMDNGLSSTKGAGYSKLEHWQQVQSLLIETKHLEKSKALDDDEFFTNEVLDRIYENGRNRYFPN